MSKKVKPRSETSKPKLYLSREKERETRAMNRHDCLEPADVEPSDAAKWDEARYDQAVWP